MTHTGLLTKDSASIKLGVDSSTTTPISNGQTGNILWGAAAAALVGATLADWQKKREEEARRLAELEAKKAANAGRPDIKAMREAEKAHDAAVRARWAAQVQAKQHVAAVESKLAREDDAEEARYVAAQKEKEKAAFDHRMSEHDGDQALVNAWKAQQEKQPAAAKVLAMPVKDGDIPEQKTWLSKIPVVGNYLDNTYSAFSNIVGNKSTTFSQKVEGLSVWAVVNNPVVQLGMKIEPVKKIAQSFTATMADSLKSIADPERNPRSDAFNHQFWDSMDAWQGVINMRKDARDAAWNALTEGRWQDFGTGVSVLAKQNLAVAKNEIWFAGMIAWGVVTTPVRIVTHDIPEFISAGKEREEGKDRLWDVLLTSTNLMGDVAGTYGMAKPVGLVDNANAGLSKLFFGQEIPNKFLPYYLKDTIFNGGGNRLLLNNLMENWNSKPSTVMTSALNFQSFYQQMIRISEEVRLNIPKIKPTQTTADLDSIYQMAAEAHPELRIIINDLAKKTNGQAQIPKELKDINVALGKIAGDYKGNASRITDVARGRVVYQTLDDLYSGLKILSDEGIIAYMKDRFLNPADSGYRDILTNVELSNNHIGELRLELKDISEFAKTEHLLYEQKRIITQAAKAEGRFLTQDEILQVDSIESITQNSYSDIWEAIIKNFK